MNQGLRTALAVVGILGLVVLVQVALTTVDTSNIAYADARDR